MDFWHIIWVVIWSFVFVAYLLVLFHIVIDLFRDSQMSGFAKALWIIGLIFVPLLTAIIYIIARGSGMATRQQAAMTKVKSDTEEYIRSVSGGSPAEHIAAAKKLLDAGTINADEFAKLKAKAIG